MFKVTSGSGFHIGFKNGYKISVQFGPHTYSGNRDLFYFDKPGLHSEGEIPESDSAEIAIFKPDKELYEFEDGDQVKGWCTAEEVAEWVDKVSKFEK